MQNLFCENVLYLHENKKYFHLNGLELNLALKQGLGANWE